MSDTTIELFLYPDGTIGYLYQETLDLRALGPATIERASHVEPNATHTAWEVRLPQSQDLLATAPTRSEALRQEVEILNERILPNLPSAFSPLG